MKKSLLAVTLGAIATLTACNPYTLTYSEVYNNADLSDFHTFRLVTPADGNLPNGMTMVTYYNIAAAIREQMVERGYTEDPSSPLLINIGLTVKKDYVNVPYTQTVAMPTYLPPAPPLPRPIPPTQMPPIPIHNGVAPVFIYPRAYYAPYYPTYGTITQWVPTVYREGVLTMDIVDTQSMSAVYSASVATILNNGDSQLRNLSGIADAVNVLFSKFPVPIQRPAK